MVKFIFQMFLTVLDYFDPFGQILQLLCEIAFGVFHLAVEDSYVCFAFYVSLQHVYAQKDLIRVQITLFAARLSESS